MLQKSSLSILIVLVLLLSAENVKAETPKPEQYQNAATHTPCQKTNSISKPAISRFIESSPQETAKPGATYNYNYTYYAEQGWDWTGVLQAVSTVGLLIFAGWQIYFIRRSTDAAQKSAEASKCAAQAALAAIHKDRPILMVVGVAANARGDVICVVRNEGSGVADIIEVLLAGENFPRPKAEPRGFFVPEVKYPEHRKRLFRLVVQPSLSEPIEIPCNIDVAEMDSDYAPPFWEGVYDPQFGVYGWIKYRGSAPIEPYMTYFFYWNFAGIKNPIFYRGPEDLNRRT